MQQLMIAAAVLAGLGGSIWLLQRRGLASFGGFAKFGGFAVRRPERKLQVIEKLQLTPQHSLCLVRMEGRTLLISTAPSSCRLLELEDTV
ncbi:flagellar biosynthetic protein FliO [Nevskia soli]|jgi:flagellar biogenesis protein FliO|uniref:flagellar biosynthetic protein FliO n=1 Tax=Nevskia soli TaxID=418856 RepID=UPI00214D795A|nr:flagellar biosynthetic protein FliO [Nevskia soli]